MLLSIPRELSLSEAHRKKNQIGKSISEPEVRNVSRRAAPLVAPSERLKLEGKKAFSSEAAAATDFFALFCPFPVRSFVPHQTCRMLGKIHTKMPSLRTAVMSFRCLALRHHFYG